MRFENKVITEDTSLDYNEFINCEFKNCKVIYHGGAFYINKVTFTNVQYVLVGSANDTLQYMKFLRNMSQELFEQLMNSKNPSQEPQPQSLN